MREKLSCNCNILSDGPAQHGPVCYDCQQERDPEKCSYVRTCEFNEVRKKIVHVNTVLK